MINAVGREIPEKIGDYVVKPYTGAYTTVPSDAPVHTKRTASKHVSGDCKMLPDIKEAVKATGLKDGMTISFHHSFREGDEIIGQVLTAIRELGIKNLRFAPSGRRSRTTPSLPRHRDLRAFVSCMA